MVSIQETVAVVDHVFQTASLNVNVNDQFQVNVFVADHQLFVIVTPVSENHVSVATTLPLVAVAGL